MSHDEVDREYLDLLRGGEPAAKPTKKTRRKRIGRFHPEEEQLFACGEVVRLRSGGPRMTVWTAEPATMEGVWPWMYLCFWFAGEELRKERFPGHVLKGEEP
jgi:uncharacterized protein YodC (DUF2158 family)